MRLDDMTCRQCGKRFDASERLVCPHCGEQYTARSGVLKSSMIFISAGDTDAIYRSVREVPQRLRDMLLKSTNGSSTRTILIANPRGREEIARAIESLPPSLRRCFLTSIDQEPEGMREWLARPAIKTAIAVMLGGASLALIWLLFTHK